MHVVDSFGTGGTEEGIRKLLSGLDPAAFEQIVCSVTPSAPNDTKTGTRVISVGRPGGGRQLLVGRLKRVFNQGRPDIVHSRNWGAIEAVAAARFAGVRAVVHSEHGLESSTYRHQPWRRNVLRRLSFAWADRVFAVSHALSAYYAQQLRIKKTRINVIPNGVDTEKFRARQEVRYAARRRLGISSDTLVVGTVGRLDPVKDHRTLFLAIDRLLASGVPVQLVIVGDGPERRALDQHVQARALLAKRTVFVGETSDVVSQLNSFDVFVIPSLAEGMSNALLEAMSVGLACIATEVGGNPELVEHGSSGLLFEAGNIGMLFTQLRELALQPELRFDLGAKARRRVETCFSLHNMLTNYTNLYKQALGIRLIDSPAFTCTASARSV